MNGNIKTISDYAKHRIEAEGIKPQTVKMQTFYLKMFAESLGNTNFKKTTENDIIQFKKVFKPATQNTILNILRRFYRWHFNIDKGDKLPKCIRNLDNVKHEKNEISYRERVITEDEFQRMLDNAHRIEHKAILETLYLYGVRVSELLSMRATDVSDDGEFVRIIVRKSKTITREIPYKGRPKYLMAWFESYQPFKGKKDKPLWINIFFKSNERFTRGGILQLIDRAAKRAGIKRKINCHDFRHTSISRDRSNGVPVSHIETKHGLVHGSLVMQVYDHNKAEDYENFLRKKKEERPETYETMKRTKDTLEAELKAENEKLREDYDTLKTTMEKMQKQLADISLHRQEMVAKEIDKIKRDNRV